MKRKLISIILAAICLVCASVLFVAANPETPVVTQGETSPAPTDAPVIPPDTTSPVASAPSGGTDVTQPAGTEVAPSDSTTPVDTVPTEPESTVPVTRPTEFQEDPGFTSDYIAPPPAFQPGEHDVQKNDWEELQVDEIVKESENKQILSVNGGNVDADSFNYIKQNTSKVDEKDPTLFIVSLVLWFAALALATFAILYRPRKKTAGADNSENKKGKKSSYRYAGKKRTGSSDEYNDGF